MINVNNVTDKVEARKKVEDAEERARLASEIAEIVTWDLNVPTQELIYSNNLLTLFGLEKNKKVTRAHILSQIFKEDIPVIEKAFEKLKNNYLQI